VIPAYRVKLSEMDRTVSAARTPHRLTRIGAPIGIAVAAMLVLALLVWQAITSGGVPNPTAGHATSAVAVLDIGVLVFREGLESILVLSAITASMVDSQRTYRRPIAAGVGAGLVATLLTWSIVIAIVDNLTTSLPALDIQAATGLLAIVVLLVVMNWFFHRVYWTGWISLHTRRKRKLMDSAEGGSVSTRSSLLWGLGLLGFTSLYREGFEVVLFLQSYRLQMGGTIVLEGVLIGAAATVLVALLTFVAHRRLPYKKMLVLTGTLLGLVLLVMVGEQAQEMQLAHWISTTRISWLEGRIPDWKGLWFSVFPTVESLAAQVVAAALVVGSYFVARGRVRMKSTVRSGDTVRSASISPQSATWDRER
jgi:high-affinity iron transporter